MFTDQPLFKNEYTMDMDRYRTSRLRMHQLKEVTELDGEGMASLRQRIATLSGNAAAGIATPSFSADNLFMTPPWLAQRMVELAGIEPHHSVLEPSAGMGNLIRAKPDARWTACEVDTQLSHYLYTHFPNLTLLQGDFLQRNPGTFDRIVMNPPFRMRADLRHIQHALTCLAPGGRLIALCLAGTRREETLRPLASSWEVIDNAFKAERTGVSVALGVYERPRV